MAKYPNITREYENFKWGSSEVKWVWLLIFSGILIRWRTMLLRKYIVICSQSRYYFRRKKYYVAYRGVFRGGGALGHGPLWPKKIFYIEKRLENLVGLCMSTSGQQKFAPSRNSKYATGSLPEYQRIWEVVCGLKRSGLFGFDQLYR